eukprot:2623692-Rhodomonas_salina.4
MMRRGCLGATRLPVAAKCRQELSKLAVRQISTGSLPCLRCDCGIASRQQTSNAPRSGGAARKRCFALCQSSSFST